MNEMLRFKRQSISLGLCEKYKELWNNATTIRQLFDIGLDSNGIDLLADSHANGWGLSKEYLKTTFGDLINGRYTRNKDGYTSELYVDAYGSIVPTSTLTLFMDCDCDITIPEYHVCCIYVSGKCNIRLTNEGICTVITYGDKYSLSVTGNGKTHYKHVPNAAPHINN